MGFRISYFATTMPKDMVLQRIAMVVDQSLDDMPDAQHWVATLTETGYCLVWLEDAMFVENNDALFRIMSKGYKIYACSVNETSMFSAASLYEDGARVWKVSWMGDEGLVPTNLQAQGDLPDTYAQLLDKAMKQAEDKSFDPFFDVPLNLAAQDIGFRHDAYLRPEDINQFETLVLDPSQLPTAPDSVESRSPKRGLLAQLFGAR